MFSCIRVFFFRLERLLARSQEALPLLLTTAAVVASAQPVNPPQLVYATYAASPPGSVLNGFAVDSTGNAYLGGVYSSCSFLTKLNQTGTAAVWSVCLPLSQINAVAVDTQGYIYVAGKGQSQPPSSGVPDSSTFMKLSSNAQQALY